MSETISSSEKYIILPYRKNKQRLVVAEMRPASSEMSAIRIAESMAGRFVGVEAYAVVVDEESGDMNDPRLLASFGEVPQQTED